ncbi:MAG TPA: sulfite exporter TauE/SafE family protein [Candidatus Saccharimonadales bacterium]|nr:sulfite exporter TauE/SafE family protein [Candidatus Saccharimonadales bacterium]
MKLMIWLLLIILGAVAGVISGLVGIGGGMVIVPALVLFFGYSQKVAQGTTLALLVPPIGILAAYTYYKHGYVNLGAAGLIVIGFVIGSFIGAKYVTQLPTATVTRLFAAALLVIAIKMLITAKA